MRCQVPLVILITVSKKLCWWCEGKERKEPIKSQRCWSWAEFGRFAIYCVGLVLWTVNNHEVSICNNLDLMLIYWDITVGIDIAIPAIKILWRWGNNDESRMSQLIDDGMCTESTHSSDWHNFSMEMCKSKVWQLPTKAKAFSWPSFYFDFENICKISSK